MDILIFTLLRQQLSEVCNFLLISRDFALGKGLLNDAQKMNSFLLENNRALLLANKQLSDLKCQGTTERIGLFDEIYLSAISQNIEM